MEENVSEVPPNKARKRIRAPEKWKTEKAKVQRFGLIVKVVHNDEFPTDDPCLYEKWIKATGKWDWLPTKHHTICSDHFDPASFVKNSKKTYLQTDAIPTLKLNEEKSRRNKYQVARKLALEARRRRKWYDDKEARILKMKKEKAIKKKQVKRILEMSRKLTEQLVIQRNAEEEKEEEEKPEQVKKAALELDKFKRRLIRAVARLLLTEKKPEEEIWTELKKETGCDCELLWARMRALTLKKLNRLFLANDRMEAVPVPARMSLTDWLMFDLVLVHQKIDLLGQNTSKDNKEDPPALVAVYELVKMFNIESLSGDHLADAWSTATLYYNNQGHHCSPMLLQRRWYQLKEATRFKFYNFWYAYRGNTTRVNMAEPYKPTPLQTNIAKTFKLLIVQPFLEWEDLIKQKMVILPDEFERKMKARAVQRKPGPTRKQSEDVPDLVVIEPRIETIDLRLEPDDNATEESSQEAMPVPPVVTIKQEPQDDMDIDETPPEPPKKSLFEVVLESTDLENSRIDSMDTDEYDLEINGNQTEENEETTVRDEDNVDTDEITVVEGEENVVRDDTIVVRDKTNVVTDEITVVRGGDTVGRDEEDSHLPQIGSVFGNVSDTSVLGNIDQLQVCTSRRKDKNAVVRETINLTDEEKPSGDDNGAGVDDNNVSVVSSEKNGDKSDENITRNNDPVIELSSDDKDDAYNIQVKHYVRDPSPEVANDIPDEVNEISDDDFDISGNVDSTEVLHRVDETSIVGNAVESSESSKVYKADVIGTEEATNIASGIDTTNVVSSIDATIVSGNVDATMVTGTPVAPIVNGTPVAPIVTSTPVATNATGHVEATNVTGTPISINVTGTPVATNVTGTPVDTNVTGNVDATNVTGTPISTNVTGTPVATNVTGTPVDTNVTGNVDATNVTGTPISTNVTGTPVATNVTGTPVDTNVTGTPDATNVTGTPVATNVTGTPVDTNVTGNVDATNVTGMPVATNITGTPVDYIEATNVAKVSVSRTTEGASQPVTSEDIVSTNILEAQTTDSTVTKAAEEKEVEIIENPVQPVVITDSEDEENIVDDLVINKLLTEAIDQTKVVPKTTVQPMEVKTKPEILEVSLTEPLKVSEDDGVKKIEIEIKPDVKGFKFGELPHDISFVDEGIEFVDDGIAYVDEDSQDEPKTKCEEDEDNPKIDPKLLMCPIIYTIRLDDMDLFRTQPFDHVEDKGILEAVTKKSKPIKRETIENVTVNYCGEKIESVTVSGDKKTIEYAPKSVGKIDDSTIVIKKEPLEVPIERIVPQEHSNVPVEIIIPQEHYNVSIENNPVDDNNVIPDDSDCDEDVIDESQKVKPTSYLLQKPRSRRYNPIQLCKNPDFNTRLKRLSVGFFSSPRNRVLIKSCKPLTIDLSKAFESKLISGTLYLKPADNTVTTEIIDDSESHSVSVVPSAMPAQSLIDNSKAADILPMLNQCLEASKQFDDVAPASERNKVINLPDITEIRRINQRLLTAEVTPIQIQNNQPQVPVSIVTSPNTRSYYPQKYVTTVEAVQYSQPTLTEATDTRGPPKLLEIIDDPPTNTEHTYASTGRYTDNRFMDGFRPRQPIGRPPRMANWKRGNPRPAPWKPRQFRPQIPWLSKNQDPTVYSTKFDETLLTIDALNKMLFLLTDIKESTEVPPKNPKPKVKRKNVAQQTKSTQRGRPRLNRDDPCNIADEEEPATSDEQNAKYQKPRINIKSATNYPPDKNKILNPESELPTQKVLYCCWARQKMYQLLFNREAIPPHGCSRLCKCCCRQLLKDHMLQEQNTKNTELQIIKATGNNADVTNLRGSLPWRINCLDDENPKTVVENPAETTVAVTVQVPCVEPIQVSDAEVVGVPEQTPIIDLDAPNNGLNTNENEVMHIETPNIEANVPSPGGEVFVTTTAVVAPPTLRERRAPTKTRRKYVTVPILRNHNFASGVTPEVGTQTFQYTRCISSDNQSGGVILNAVKTPNTKITPIVTSQSSLPPLLAVKKTKVLNTPKTNMSLPSASTKHVREKMIFLNSKQISDKPTASPVHLGKNKILLTTIKFPSNLRLFNEAKKALEPSFNLPTGVNIILLADGTVSFKIDPNVEVNATDMKEMPEKIAAICAHMHTQAAQEEALKKQSVTPATAEVVDLVGDDDVTETNLTENDNESPLAGKVQTTEENVTINSDALYPSETEEKSTGSNINTNVIDEESNQNENVENIVIDIQENMQESTQNEMLSASTEQLKGQPDPSSKVSAETDYQPNPSIQTESSEVQKVTVEHSQDHPDSSGHQVSDDIDLANTSSQIESSDVREGKVLIEQETQSKTTGQNTTIEVQDLPKPATEKLSTEVPEESTSAPSRPKSKNILSDLMEMSGIFDEDMTPDTEETAVPAQSTEQVAGPQAALQTLIPAPQVMRPPALTTVCQGTTIARPIVIPTAFNRDNPVSPKIQSAIGELTAITSLYELKYACANKGIFFKLDMDTGYLIPINVCMKGIKPVCTPTASRKIAPKSVIDLTEDDDNPEQHSVELNTSPETSPRKSSLLRDSIASGGSVAGLVATDSPVRPVPKPLDFTGPARPVKLFKALKPSILQKLNLSKLNQMSKNLNNTALDHKKKRKQFLMNINLNADTDLDSVEEHTGRVLMRPFLKKIKLKRNLMHTYKSKKNPDDEPIATTSCTEPIKEFATTIMSDDSSDDEPLAKIAKKKHENESLTKEIELDLPVTDSHKDIIEREAPVGEQTESELPAADVESAMNDNIDQEALLEKQNQIELPGNDNASVDDSASQANELAAADTESYYMSDDDNDFIDSEAPFGFDSNEEDEDNCILGV